MKSPSSKAHRACVAAALAVALALAGCGRRTDQTIAGNDNGSRLPPSTAARPALPKGGLVTPAQAWNQPTGHRIPVIDPRDPTNRGWVDWTIYNPLPGQAQPEMAPIYADADTSRQLAWYGRDAGWITLEQAAAPGFSEPAFAAQLAAKEQSP
jgi:hypothetical protein